MKLVNGISIGTRVQKDLSHLKRNAYMEKRRELVLVIRQVKKRNVEKLYQNTDNINVLQIHLKILLVAR